MRRSRRLSRTVTFIMLGAVGIGGFAVVNKLRRSGRSPAAPLPLMAVQKAATPGSLTSLDDAPLPPINPTGPGRTASRTLLLNNIPATQPVLTSPQLPASVALSGSPLADAKARLDAGDPTTARRILSDAVAANQVADLGAMRTLLDEINKRSIFSGRISKDDPYCSTYVIKPGETLTKIAAGYNVNWELLCRMNGIANPSAVPALKPIKVVKGPFHAVVNKRSFTLNIYLGAPGGAGSALVSSFLVGLGKDDSTPTGTWQVGRRLPKPVYYSPRGEGVIPYGDPKNPLGTCWIALVGIDGQAVGKMSYGIHGTNEPDTVGKQSSMGCIRLRNDEAERVYQFLSEGKSMVIVKE